MSEALVVFVNGQPLRVEPECTVAAAICIAGAACRTSVDGQPRGPLCGMGICFECRATVNGLAHTRTCQTLCEPAMEIETA